MKEECASNLLARRGTWYMAGTENSDLVNKGAPRQGRTTSSSSTRNRQPAPAKKTQGTRRGLSTSRGRVYVYVPRITPHPQAKWTDPPPPVRDSSPSLGAQETHAHESMAHRMVDVTNKTNKRPNCCGRKHAPVFSNSRAKPRLVGAWAVSVHSDLSFSLPRILPYPRKDMSMSTSTSMTTPNQKHKTKPDSMISICIYI